MPHRSLLIVRRIAVAVLLLVVLGNAAFAAGVWLTREPAPRAYTSERVFDIARPAMALIQSDIDVTTSLPDPTVTGAQRQHLVDQLQRMVDTGQLPYNDTAINQAAMRIILGDPASYFTAGDTRDTEDDQVVATGSGFFVTESGEFVTAAHVVAPRKDDIRQEILDFSTHPTELAALRKDLADSIHTDVGINPTDAELDQLVKWYQDYASKNLTVDRMDARFFVGTGTVHAGTALDSTGARASLQSADAPFPGRDIALLKVDVSSVPALALAPGDPTIGETAVIAGYPRQGYLDEEVRIDATVPPVYTSGRVAGREVHDGFTAYGTTASATHGNSGGPVLDGGGQVLGLLSYGEGPDAKESGNGYFIPAASIRAKLAEAGVKPDPGTLTARYRAALTEGDAAHYRHELPILEGIHQASAWDAYVGDDIMRTQSALLAGTDRTPLAVAPYSARVMAASVGVTALMVLVVLTASAVAVVGRRRTAGDATEVGLLGSASNAGEWRPRS